MIPEEPMPTDLLKPSKAAKLMGLHINTIYRWINEGRLSAWRVGCHLRVSEAAVRALPQKVEPVKKPAPKFSRKVQKQWESWSQKVLERHGLASKPQDRDEG